RNIGSIALQLVGHVTQDQARIETTEAELFGGKWRLHAFWPSPDDSLRVQVDLEDVSLAEVAGLVHQPNLSGQLSGSWTLDIPSADRTRITASGTSEFDDVAVGKFQAQHIQAGSRLEDGKLVVDPIHLQQQDGQADVHVDLAVKDPKHLNVKA